jgi:hypothetical protein
MCVRVSSFSSSIICYSYILCLVGSNFSHFALCCWTKFPETQHRKNYMSRQHLNIHSNCFPFFPFKHFPFITSQFRFSFVIAYFLPITVAARSMAWTVFARSKTGVLGSNLTWGMDVCVRLFWVCTVLCAGSALATGWSPSKESYQLCKSARKRKSDQGPTKGCRDIGTRR